MQFREAASSPMLSFSAAPIILTVASARRAANARLASLPPTAVCETSPGNRLAGLSYPACVADEIKIDAAEDVNHAIALRTVFQLRWLQSSLGTASRRQSRRSLRRVVFGPCYTMRTGQAEMRSPVSRSNRCTEFGSGRMRRFSPGSAVTRSRNAPVIS